MATQITSSNQIDQIVNRAITAIENALEYANYYATNGCFRRQVNLLFNQVIKGDGIFSSDIPNNSLDNVHPIAAGRIYKEALPQSKQFLENCLRSQYSVSQNTQASQNVPPTDFDGQPLTGTSVSPFDRRIQRLYQDTTGNLSVITPYDTRFQQVSTIGHIISDKKVRESKVEDQDTIIAALKDKRGQMKKDNFYIGVPSLINTYSITKLYGTKGGEFLVNRKGERKWYEIDQSSDDNLGFSLSPTTSSLISWGNGDPYGRTPYHFTDFVFSKYWNIIPNNRLITLRRFAAPIVDNMKFPGMDGLSNSGTTGLQGDSSSGVNATGGQGTEDQGTGKKITFPPMATAITYFGEETENSLSNILKFTTEMKWGDVQADVFKVSSESNPDMEAGPGGIFGGLLGLSKMLNIATGNFDTKAILNKGNLPPDPYEGGPYENRVIGPVNRIDTVKKREAGLTYENKISLVFEYVARPIGGVNTKAVLLDILSNFLIIGSASAMFWGGQHRFMGQPQKYPFLGGDKGIQQWYSGNPTGWAQTSVTSFTEKLFDGGSKMMDFAKSFFNTILGKGGDSGMGGIANLLSGDNAGANLIKAKAAEKSAGQIPYLTGLKALLIGEPVGEWHVTIGNPLNPIAMIGNLICENIEVEFGDELGPDDFPLTIKIKVNLEHGMPRDRDAIQSIFNRGMGRIYELPDNMAGSADYETRVDKNTGNQTKTGTSPSYAGGTFIADSGTTGGKFGRPATKKNVMASGVSVWNRDKFSVVSATQDLSFTNGILNRSSYRAAEWVTLKALK
jgi:hypothetical protein